MWFCRESSAQKIIGVFPWKELSPCETKWKILRWSFLFVEKHMKWRTWGVLMALRAVFATRSTVPDESWETTANATLQQWRTVRFVTNRWKDTTTAYVTARKLFLTQILWCGIGRSIPSHEMLRHRCVASDSNGFWIWSHVTVVLFHNGVFSCCRFIWIRCTTKTTCGSVTCVTTRCAAENCGSNTTSSPNTTTCPAEKLRCESFGQNQLTTTHQHSSFEDLKFCFVCMDTLPQWRGDVEVQNYTRTVCCIIDSAVSIVITLHQRNRTSRDIRESDTRSRSVSNWKHKSFISLIWSVRSLLDERRLHKRNTCKSSTTVRIISKNEDPRWMLQRIASSFVCCISYLLFAQDCVQKKPSVTSAAKNSAKRDWWLLTGHVTQVCYGS